MFFYGNTPITLKNVVLVFFMELYNIEGLLKMREVEYEKKEGCREKDTRMNNLNCSASIVKYKSYN